jgi:hypothetical protein
MYTNKHAVFGTGQWLVCFQDLKQACFEANDVVFAYTPVKFHTEDIVQFHRARMYMGIIAVFDGTAELPIHLGQVGFLQETVGFLNG